MSGHRPQAWLDGCRGAHRRFEAVVDTWAAAGGDPESACKLDGWSCAQLLAHVARNADSHTAMVRAAIAGEIGAQYPGGVADREAGINAGSGRSAAELADDIRTSNAALEAAWDDAGDEVWAVGLGQRILGLVTIADAVFLRWREAEIHLVDLGLDAARWDDLPATYVGAEFDRTFAGLAARLPSGTVAVVVADDRPSRAAGWGDDIVVVRGRATEVLAWMAGRRANADLPPLGPWF